MVIAASCSRTSPEIQVINDAANALGGKERIQQVRTITIEGEGDAPNLGQNITPDSPLPNWKVTEFRRTIDVTNARVRTKQVRTAQFLLASSSVQRVEQGIDADVGYNIDENGVASRASTTVVRDRRIEFLHHPLLLIRAALDSNAQITNARSEANAKRVDLTTASGEVLTIDMDNTTKLPVRVASLSDNPNLGDVVIETTFADYDTVNGVKLPKRITTKIDRYPQFDLRVTKNTLDENIGDISAPADVKTQSIPPAAAVTVTAEKVGNGIWWLAGSGNHRSIVFEFDDHLVLFEVPVSETRSKAVIDTARTLSPKPLTHAIVSHHHFDHSGGLRVAVAEGLTIITYQGNVDFFKELVSRPHTIVQDALARNPKPLKIEAVDDELTLKDKSMEVRLYHLKENPREGTNLFAYVPDGKILIQADMYDSGWMRHPWGDNLPYNLTLRKLPVEKSVPVHGTIQSYPDVLKTIASKKTE